ncbi:hypothetical protein RSK60_1600016 [Ralstonia solanacearum K60]|nr:hypothetical protein RSK60_1600016 [Ralstonia solanacearum K60]
MRHIKQDVERCKDPITRYIAVAVDPHAPSGNELHSNV